MNRVLLAIFVITAMTAVCMAETGFVNFNSASKVTASTHAIGKVNAVSGLIQVKPDTACTVYMNYSTTARSKAATGYPMAANTDYRFNIPNTSTMTFLCATSATVPKSVYIMR